MIWRNGLTKFGCRCTACGWTGQRIAKGMRRPCPKCNGEVVEHSWRTKAAAYIAGGPRGR